MKRRRSRTSIPRRVLGRPALPLALALLTLGPAVQGPLTTTAGAQPPPVHEVDGRWSAWDAPPPAEGTPVYLIENGDTLWDLAEKYYGNPYLWPQLWEANPYILDAQWIYPGDPLVIPTHQVTPPDGVAGPPITEMPEAGPPSTDDPFRAAMPEATSDPDSGDDDSTFEELLAAPSRGTEAPVPLGYESDIYCTGFVGDLRESFPYYIAGSEYEFLNPTLDPARESDVKGLWGKTDTVKFLLGLGDIVFLDGGRADGLSAGMVLAAVEPRERVVHPLTKDLLGRYYRYMGRVRVLSAQDDRAIGEIIGLCDPFPVGIALRLFEPEPVPLRRMTPMRPINFPASEEEVRAGPTIILARDNVVTLGQGNLVFIDQGFGEDLAPGDIFTVYRRGRRGFPPIVIGEAAVLSVFEKASLARILRSRYAIYVGDSMVLK